MPLSSVSPLRLALAAVFALGSSAVGAQPASVAAPTVQVATGTLAGKRAEVGGVALELFQGIPYAAPPVGALRWKPPQPVAPWDGVRQATRFAANCMQYPIGDMVFRSSGMSEDCLYLNVWTPGAESSAKRPVLVYFYGGGFVAGDGSEPRYDGASLASKGIVTVTVNYRLGVFGFFALPALADESPVHAAGNYGLLDQVAALKWVKSNIARFGGDPQHITIGGESAGSIAVSELMAAPSSRGLIAGAIGESGALIAPIAPISKAAAERQGEAFMRKVGAHSLAQLRALPAATLLAATKDQQDADASPDLDGLFLTEPPAAIFARGEQAPVPVLLGTNSQEGYYGEILGDATPTPAHYRAALETIFGAATARVLALYPGNDEAQVKASGTALAGDIFIAHSTWRWMDALYRSGKAPVYWYYFAQPRPAKLHPAPGEHPDAGAVHSGEIEFALGNLAGNHVYAWTPADRQTSAQMEGYFANFIKHGTPNGAGLPAWPAVAAKDGGLTRQWLDAHPHPFIDRNAAREAFLRSWFTDHQAPF